jgi:exonuclease SbcD
VWVDLTIQTDEFLTAAQTKMINDSHKRIVTLRPLVTNTKSDTINGSNIAELIKDKDALFAKYFETINGQSPNEEIMNLFHEILAQ